MKNPKWTQDELILALDLYFDIPEKIFSPRDKRILKLSYLLNKLSIYDIVPNEESYRNPNGCAMKLYNFARFDPDFKGKTLEAGGKLDEKIWDEFRNDRKKLKSLAAQIINVIQKDDLHKKLYLVPEDEELGVNEGRVLYKLHKFKERNISIINKKKELVLKKTGKLNCEICGFDFYEKYGEIGKGFIECHHTNPLMDLEAETKTKISDLALVCSNCHSILHRNIENLSITELREILKGKDKT